MEIEPMSLEESSDSLIINHKCEKCGLEFNSEINYEEHKNFHDFSFNCSNCDYICDSWSNLLEHIESQHTRVTVKDKFECTKCGKRFNARDDLDEHMKAIHGERANIEDWNCDDCSFGDSCPTELMKHLQITTHQPSKHIKDKRKVFLDYKQCYTCKKDFDGYINLMNHRKQVHPSNKICKYFSEGDCRHGEECWYVHELNEIQGTSDSFKCDLCKKEFKGRDNFMKHNKIFHISGVPNCEKFIDGKCMKRANECWFVHPTVSANHISHAENVKKSLKPENIESLKENSDMTEDFQEILGNIFPPDQTVVMTRIMKSLLDKMITLEEKITRTSNQI